MKSKIIFSLIIILLIISAVLYFKPNKKVNLTNQIDSLNLLINHSNDSIKHLKDQILINKRSFDSISKNIAIYTDTLYILQSDNFKIKSKYEKISNTILNSNDSIQLQFLRNNLSN